MDKININTIVGLKEDTIQEFAHGFIEKVSQNLFKIISIENSNQEEIYKLEPVLIDNGDDDLKEYISHIRFTKGDFLLLVDDSNCHNKHY